MYSVPAPAARQVTKARSGSSVWLERSPVTAEVASSSLVRFVPTQRRECPARDIPFFVFVQVGIGIISPPRQVSCRWNRHTDEAWKPCGLPRPEPPAPLRAGSLGVSQDRGGGPRVQASSDSLCLSRAVPCIRNPPLHGAACCGIVGACNMSSIPARTD